MKVYLVFEQQNDVYDFFVNCFSTEELANAFIDKQKYSERYWVDEIEVMENLE